MIFPHPLLANDDGLLAFGGDLSPDTLMTAYSWGIFPWYSSPPILWWFTHPRCVLYPSKVKVSKSMRSYFNQNKFRTTRDQCFHEVISLCAAQKRNNQDSTWIDQNMIDAYSDLHQMGFAHSVEIWESDDLVGGLYGVALGKIFFGESMFTKVANASKFGLISLCRFLNEKGYELIDCQQETSHLVSMGAELMSKNDFFQLIKKNQKFENISW